MKTSDLLSMIKEQGITPFLLYDEADDGDTSRVQSELNDFLSNLKSIGVTTVLVKKKLLSQEDFEREIQIASDEEGIEEDRIIDIASIVSDLENYKKRIGIEAFHTIECVIAQRVISLGVKEEWWEQFEELRQQAYEQIEEDEEKALELEELRQETEERESEENERRLLKSLDEFLKDEEFTSLPTQRAMMSYVMDKLPELENLPAKDVKARIQRLHGRIDAKRKRKS